MPLDITTDDLRRALDLRLLLEQLEPGGREMRIEVTDKEIANGVRRIVMDDMMRAALRRHVASRLRDLGIKP